MNDTDSSFHFSLATGSSIQTRRRDTDEDVPVPTTVTVEVQETGDDDDAYFFDPSDDITAKSRLAKAFHLSIDGDYIRSHVVDAFLDNIPDDEMFGMHEPFDTYAFGLRTATTMKEAAALQPYLAFRPLEVVRQTIEHTTQLGATMDYRNMRAHLKSLMPWANKTRLNETVSTDTIFADTRDVRGSTCAQVFYGLLSHMINVYGMRSENEGPNRLDDFLREEGIPTIMRSDNSRMQRYGKGWLKRLRELLIHAEFCEPHNQQQNPVELRAIRWLKDASKVIMKRTGAPRHVWLQAMEYLADIHNSTSDETLEWRTPRSVRTGTQTDISPLIQFQFWEPVVYLDTEEKFPSTKEKLGRWVGLAHNVGDFFCWKIYDELSESILERSVVRSRRTQPNRAAENDFKRIVNIQDNDGNDSDSTNSLPTWGPTSMAIRPDPVRKERLKQRRKLKKVKEQECTTICRRDPWHTRHGRKC
jgi:hypothetical protein